MWQQSALLWRKENRRVEAQNALIKLCQLLWPDWEKEVERERSWFSYKKAKDVQGNGTLSVVLWRSECSQHEIERTKAGRVIGVHWQSRVIYSARRNNWKHHIITKGPRRKVPKQVSQNKCTPDSMPWGMVKKDSADGHRDLWRQSKETEFGGIHRDSIEANSISFDHSVFVLWERNLNA